MCTRVLLVRNIVNENRNFVQKENVPRLPHSVAYTQARTAAEQSTACSATGHRWRKLLGQMTTPGARLQ